MLNNTSFRITNFIVVLWRDRKNRVLKNYSYDCSALKNYTTLQFSGDELCCILACTSVIEYCMYLIRISTWCCTSYVHLFGKFSIMQRPQNYSCVIFCPCGWNLLLFHPYKRYGASSFLQFSKVSSHLSGGLLVREFFSAIYRVRVRVRVSRVSRVSRVGRVSRV